MRGLYLMLLLAVVAALAIVAVGLVLSVQPDTVQVDYDSAFVYPDGSGYVLALESGPYRLDQVEPVGGCYRLYPPSGGDRYGRAEWIWFACGK